VTRSIYHTAKICWYRYEEDSGSEPRTTVVASSSDVDINCYMDSGATDHITGGLDKLSMHDPYSGDEQIHAANGLGMDITHVGNSIIPTPIHNLVLNHDLHVPSAHKNPIPYIALPLIITPLLNFTLISS
jgi:hypothetical protein